MAGPLQSPAQQAANAKQNNLNARHLILQKAVRMTQSIAVQVVTAPQSPNNVVNISPQNVGLIEGFWVECWGTITNTGTSSLSLTTLNIANFLTGIMFADLNNNIRINTSGWHLNFVNSAKSRRVFGSTVTLNNATIKYGANYDGPATGQGLIAAPATIASAATGVIQMLYWVPMSYSNWDLRGGIYANIVNATMNLQLTINPNPVIAPANDTTLGIYTSVGATSGSFISASVNVYQQYLDQLPISGGRPILPVMDLSTIYELKNTALQGLSANQEFPVPYANFRDFLSTCFIFDQISGTNAGTDISYIALQSANFTNIFKVDPYLLSEWARDTIHDDFPKGGYYIDHRTKPISTIQYGNLNLIVNPSTVSSATAQLLVGFEDFAMINSITSAGSLPGG